jgi:hypothetical protein
MVTLASFGSTLTSLRAWRRAGGREPPGDTGGDGGQPSARSLFVPLIGTAAGAFFTLVILAQWFATWVLSPCTY